jgi:hypothetical protein
VGGGEAVKGSVAFSPNSPTANVRQDSSSSSNSPDETSVRQRGGYDGPILAATLRETKTFTTSGSCLKSSSPIPTAGTSDFLVSSFTFVLSPFILL